ncbi:hypothetical protein TKK_0019510 [Trichogramma kaykai]
MHSIEKKEIDICPIASTSELEKNQSEFDRNYYENCINIDESQYEQISRDDTADNIVDNLDVMKSIQELFYGDENLCSSESSNESDNKNYSSNEIDIKNQRFIDEVNFFCTKHLEVLPHYVINDMLDFLRKNTDVPFPKDSRTLLHTPRFTNIIKIDNGLYCHYGLKRAVLSFIYKINKWKKIIYHHLKLIVNIDGAPLAKNSEKGLWIISVSEEMLKIVESVGIYHGPNKPSNSNDLIKAFVDEMKDIVEKGIIIEDKKYTIDFHALVCDAPAKAYILKIKYHTGFWSCSKCKIKGKYIEKLCFPGKKDVLRTDEGFREKKYQDDGLNDGYQQGETLLLNIPGFGLVKNVPLDYMHLICLGVMLKLIKLWLKCRLSNFQRQQITSKLTIMRDHMPSDFSRKPRSFINAKRVWKAHEFRQFLLLPHRGSSMIGSKTRF